MEERIRDVISSDCKVVVFTSFNDGLNKHKAVFSGECVTISGSDNAEQRMQAVDRFQNDPEVRVRPAAGFSKVPPSDAAREAS